MADFPTLVKPAFITPFRVPGAIGSVGQTGRVQLRSSIAIGREWDMTWNAIRAGTPDVDALFAFIEDAWSQGKTFDLTHPYSPGSGLAKHGYGGGTVRVNGASQTGSSLVTDGWSATNLVTNPGFETGVMSPHIATGNGGTWAVSGTTPIFGSFSATYDPTGATADAYLYLNGPVGSSSGHVVVSEGQKITVYMYAKVDAGTGSDFRVNLDWRNAAGVQVSETVGVAITPNTTAALAQVTDTAPAGATYVVARPYVINAGNTTLVRFDDAVLFRSHAAKAGDVFRIDGLPQLFRVMADAAMDVNGNATLTVSPPIMVGSSPIENGLLIMDGAKLTAYIASPPNLPAVPPGRYVAGLTLTLREAL